MVATLDPDAGDDEAQRVAEPLYAETTQLYATCVAPLYAQALASDRPLTGACGEPGAPKLEGPHVIVYGSLDFAESTCELVQGAPVEDGCSSTGGGTSGPHDTGPVTSVEVAYDPDTCRSLVETGRLRDDSP